MYQNVNENARAERLFLLIKPIVLWRCRCRCRRRRRYLSSLLSFPANPFLRDLSAVAHVPTSYQSAREQHVSNRKKESNWLKCHTESSNKLGL